MKIEVAKNSAGEVTGYVVRPFCDPDATLEQTSGAFAFGLDLCRGRFFGTIKGINGFAVSLELARQYRNALNEIIRFAEENLPMGIVNSKEAFTLTRKDKFSVFKGGRR